jgi:hypothetical protein
MTYGEPKFGDKGHATCSKQHHVISGPVQFGYWGWYFVVTDVDLSYYEHRGWEVVVTRG